MNCIDTVCCPARHTHSTPSRFTAFVLVAWLAVFGCSGEKTNPGVNRGERAHAGDAGQVGGPGHAVAIAAGTATSVGEGSAPEIVPVDDCCPPESSEDAVAEGAAASDLDASVEALLARSCEHEIPQYTCDECRYEVGMVKVSPDLFAPGGLLSTARATARRSGAGRVLNGEVALDADKAVRITPRVPGVVQSMQVDVGSPVARGQVLIVLDSPDVSEARSVWRRARAAHRLAEATAAREADLFARRVCPKKDLLEAEAVCDQAEAEERAAASRLAGYGLDPASVESDSSAGAASAEGRYAIRAPFAGRVLERSVNLGASVEPGQELLLVGDTSRMWILAQVYERELAVILGAQARGEVQADVTVPAYPGQAFPGRVDRMSGTLDSATRTARIRIIADNPEGLLRAGMFARVNLRVGDGAMVLAVPAEAVLEDAGRSFVFVPTTPPYFLRRPVQAGLAADGWVEILGGMREGDTVVSRGAFQLKSDVLRSKMGAGCAD